MASWETIDLASLSTEEYLSLPDVIPWERLPNETERAWLAFSFYCDMGPSRTQAAIRIKGGLTVAHDWPQRFTWTKRSAAFDDYTARVQASEYLADSEEMRARHAKRAAAVLDGLMAPVEALQKKMEDDPEATIEALSKLPVEALIDKIQTSARVLQPVMSAERLARDLPTEISRSTTETQVTVDSTNPERLGELLRALGPSVLDALVGARGIGEVIDAEVVELDPDRPASETDSLPASAAS